MNGYVPRTDRATILATINNSRKERTAEKGSVARVAGGRILRGAKVSHRTSLDGRTARERSSGFKKLRRDTQGERARAEDTKRPN